MIGTICWNLKTRAITDFPSNQYKQNAAVNNILRETSYVCRSTRLLIGRVLCALTLWTIPVGHAFAGPIDIPLLDEPQTLLKIEFLDEWSNSVTLEMWSGKIVVLNIWATWCGPCRTEMPTLDHLQGALGSERFEVVALSIDEAGLGVVKQFFNEIGIKNLGIYIDPTYTAANQLMTLGLPTTLLIDTKGQELGRLVGPAEWDTPYMIEFFEEIIAEHF